ncbi:MAG: outer membrane lipoprotein carrier protein [Paraglaciecola sp.]|jgi:outer membrane lipoprotein carrier protein
MQLLSRYSINIGRVLSTSLSVFLLIPTSSLAQTQTTQAVDASQKDEVNRELEKPNAAEQLKQKLLNLRSFEASFVQKVTDVNHEVLQQAQGIIALKQPNKLFWKLDEPNESILIADGQTLWHIDPFVEQVVALEQQQSIENNPLILLTNAQSDAWKNFNVTQQGNTFSINTTQTDASIVKLVLRFEQEKLLELNMQDGQEQLSQLVFDEIKQNQPIDDARFVFELPEGYDLDDQRK